MHISLFFYLLKFCLAAANYHLFGFFAYLSFAEFSILSLLFLVLDSSRYYKRLSGIHLLEFASQPLLLLTSYK